MRFAVFVDVMPREEISDPQGLTIERALPRLGYDGVEHVRVGKRIEFVVEAADEVTASRLVSRACETFLTNPQIESFKFTLSVLEVSG